MWMKMLMNGLMSGRISLWTIAARFGKSIRRNYTKFVHVYMCSVCKEDGTLDCKQQEENICSIKGEYGNNTSTEVEVPVTNGP